MAENLREVIARLKAQNSQPQKAKVVEPVAPAIQDEDEEELEEDEEEQVVPATPKREEKAVESKVNPSYPKNTEDQENINQQRALIQQVEALQNNGVFRYELLAQLDLIGKGIALLLENNGK